MAASSSHHRFLSRHHGHHLHHHQHHSHSTATASTTHSSSNKGERSTISVDLGLKGSGAALRELHDTHQCKRNVKSAYIHAQSCVWYGPQPQVNFMALLMIFENLGNLPNLQQVTVDLNDLPFPVQALTVLLKNAKSLTGLHLHHLILETGSNGDQEYKALKAEIQQHTHLSSVSIVCCHRTHAFQKLLPHLTALKEFQLSCTRLPGGAINAITTAAVDSVMDSGKALVDICKCPNFKTLILEDNSNLTDQDLIHWAGEMAKLNGTTNLQEFKVVSSSLRGDLTGEAICDMLLENRTIQKLTLQLAGQWEKCGKAMGRVLKSNTTLVDLELGVYGGLPKAVVTRAAQIVKALGRTPKNHLKRLHLHLDVDSVLDGDLHKTKLMQAIEKVLETNDKLKDLCIFDDCLYPFELTQAVQTKLEQNKSGISKLLHKRNINVPNFYETYAESIIANKDNLDLVFFALSENPTMLIEAAAAASSATERTLPKQSSLASSSPSSMTNGKHTASKRPGNARKLYHRIFPRTTHRFSRRSLA